MKKNTKRIENYDRKSAGSIEMLNLEEEQELSKRILAGEEAKKELACSGEMGEAEKTSLLQIIDEGERAYDRLVLANQPRAAKIAAEAYRKNPHGLNDFDDYQQTAMNVICRCARTYDWRKGFRFGTYVYRSLKNEMIRENARNGYSLRISEEDLPIMNDFLQWVEKYGIHGAASAFGMKYDEAVGLLLAIKVKKSLDEPVDVDGTDTELGDLIADEDVMTSVDVEEKIDLEIKCEKMRAAFSALPEKESILLKGRVIGSDGDIVPLREFVGTVAKSISGVQKKQIAAVEHLRELYISLPRAE